MRMSRWKSHIINNWRHFSYMLFNLGNNLLSQLNEKKQLRREKKKTLAKYFLIFEQMVWIVSPSIRVKWERHFDEWDVFAQIQPSHNKTSITYFYSSDFSCDIRCRSSFLSLSLSALVRLYIVFMVHTVSIVSSWKRWKGTFDCRINFFRSVRCVWEYGVVPFTFAC